MPTALPLACTLTATEMSLRLAEMAAIGEVALLSADTADRRATLRFRAVADTRERLAAIVAAESECCAFLDMALRDESDALALTISAPPGAEPVLDDLVAAFSRAART